MHLSHEAYIEQQQAEAVHVAELLLVGNTDFLVAVRHLSGLRHEIGTSSSDEDFNIFLVIDSQTDHLPAGETKLPCSPEWLKKSALAVKDIEFFYHSELVAACNKLIKRFSHSA